MSETKVVGPEARRRVRRPIMTFLGLSAPGLGASVLVEARDPNAFSLSQSLMGFADAGIVPIMLASEKLDAHGWHKSAQVGRVALGLFHIGVAGLGTATVFDRLRSQESASSTSLAVSLGVAAFSAAAIFYERRKDKIDEILTEASDRYHELSRGMARRLFQTKLGEAAFTAMGVSAQMMTTAEHPTTGIAAIAAAGTFASVAVPMFTQVKEEWQHRRELGNIGPDNTVDNLAA